MPLTHGLCKNKNHASATCQKRAKGHSVNATLDNLMGGNNTACVAPVKQPFSSTKIDGEKSLQIDKSASTPTKTSQTTSCSTRVVCIFRSLLRHSAVENETSCHCRRAQHRPLFRPSMLLTRTVTFTRLLYWQ